MSSATATGGRIGRPTRPLRRLAPYARPDIGLALVASAAFIVLNVLRAGPFDFSNVEVAAFVTGAWSVWLVVKNDVWNWPIGIANGGIFVWLFFDAKLYADAGINAFYVVAGAYGWWFWMRGGSAAHPAPDQPCGAARMARDRASRSGWGRGGCTGTWSRSVTPRRSWTVSRPRSRSRPSGCRRAATSTSGSSGSLST